MTEVALQERRVEVEAQVGHEAVTEVLEITAQAEAEAVTEVPPSQKEMTEVAARAVAEVATEMLGLQLQDLHLIRLVGPEAEVGHQKSENVL